MGTGDGFPVVALSGRYFSKLIYCSFLLCADGMARALSGCSCDFQVMDVKDASEKIKAMRKPDTTLVCFFGDNEFGWFPTENLVSFQGHYEEKLRQKGAQQRRVSSHCLSHGCSFVALQIYSTMIPKLPACFPGRHHCSRF